MGGMWAKEREGINRKGGKRCSQTGTRTRVCWVRASYPNHLDYLGSRTIHTHNTNNQCTRSIKQTTTPQRAQPHATHSLARSATHRKRPLIPHNISRHTQHTDHSTPGARPQSHHPNEDRERQRRTRSSASRKS